MREDKIVMEEKLDEEEKTPGDQIPGWEDGLAQESQTTRETLVDGLSSEKTSFVRKYQELYVGNNSFIELLKYEFLTFFFSPVPGAIGFFLHRLAVDSLPQPIVYREKQGLSFPFAYWFCNELH